MLNRACADIQYLTSADVARIAIQRGDSLTPAGIRLAAAAGRLRNAATTAGGVRLFVLEDVEAFLRARGQKRRGGGD